MEKSIKQEQLARYQVWDRTVLIFHWVNVLRILGLIAIGTAILNGKTQAVSSDDKVILKTTHVYIGYIFVLNLTWRLIWSILSQWRNGNATLNKHFNLLVGGHRMFVVTPLPGRL